MDTTKTAIGFVLIMVLGIATIISFTKVAYAEFTAMAILDFIAYKTYNEI